MPSRGLIERQGRELVDAPSREIIDMLSRELCDMLSQVLLDTPSSALIKRLSRECIDRLGRELIDALSHELIDFSAEGPALKSGTPWRLGLQRAAGAFVSCHGVRPGAPRGPVAAGAFVSRCPSPGASRTGPCRSIRVTVAVPGRLFSCELIDKLPALMDRVCRETLSARRQVEPRAHRHAETRALSICESDK